MYEKLYEDLRFNVPAGEFPMRFTFRFFNHTENFDNNTKAIFAGIHRVHTFGYKKGKDVKLGGE